jgi:hypothetical protein
MPRLSVKARLKQGWFRFKKWAKRRFGPKAQLAWDTDCPACGSEVVWGADTHDEDKMVVVTTGFRCVKCGWRPPAEAANDSKHEVGAARMAPVVMDALESVRTRRPGDGLDR